ncbi:MAG: hypothetical protein ACTSRK_20935, partial [Promethearchaeota archaeon]
GLHGDPAEILNFLSKDKKNQNDQIVLILLQEIGKPIISIAQTNSQMKAAIKFIVTNRSLQ